MNKERIKKYFQNLIKSKLFWACAAFYILVPIISLFVLTSNNSFRTAGRYCCYENGEIVSEIILKKNNNVTLVFNKELPSSDLEYTNRQYAVKWSYRVSSWSDSFDKDEFPNISREYVIFGKGDGKTYFVFFKIDNKLYSTYLMDEARGGGQKCYIKK